MVSSCPGEPIRGSEVLWIMSPKSGLGRALGAPTSSAYSSPGSEAELYFCTQQMSCSGHLTPGKAGCVGTQAPGKET